MDNGIPRPNFFIAGAPKCGTSSMHDYLGQHPECYMSEEMKEPGFFNPDLRVNTVRRADTEEKYLALFRKGVGKRRLGESSTWYMLSKVAAKLIAEWDGLSQAILMIRNPMDAAYSLHGQLLWSCNEHLEDFEEAIAAEEERREGKKIRPECTSPDALQYTEVFSYAPQIQRFYDALGRDRVKVIVFDDFVLNTGQVYRDTLQFLGLDVEFEADFKVVNPLKPVAPAVNSFFAKRPKLRNVVHKLVPAGVQRKLADAMPFVTKTIQRAPKISAEVRERLIPRFKEDVETVSELVGRDLTYWCKVE
ncbi:MAG TPA: sulfotransferase domain-containing protein [Tepidisphaeraceae bacterium]|nr:sulfotransferase domain-containing protein [Tepidisphaeraceae bacterium]